MNGMLERTKDRPQRRTSTRIVPALDLLVVLFVIGTLQLPAQVSPPAQQQPTTQKQVPAEVRTMTPEQIDARLRELGISREEAETRARQQGIDINAMLYGRTPAPQTPGQSTPQTSPQQTGAQAEATPLEQQVTYASRQEVEDTTSKYFGYNIFRNVPASFEPSAVGPVDPDYVIGPDDVLRIVTWGQSEIQQEVTVDKEGRVFIPTVGQVLVSGLTLEKAYERLRSSMSRSYSGLVSDPRTIWLDVTVATMRPKKVFMMGQLKSPGGYTVSSYANVFNSIYSIGGPTVQGSLRDVRVIRNGKIVARVDLYDYLTGSPTTNDVRVQNNDIIFVPSRGKTVHIEGEVRIPAIFELKDGEDLMDLVRFAGGLNSTAFGGRFQIERILPLKERRKREPERLVLDIHGDRVFKKNEKILMEDGDLVKVFSIADAYSNFVMISGAVGRPGMYQLETVQTVRDLVIAAGELLPVSFKERAQVIRTNPDRTLKSIEIDLEKAMLGEPEHNLVLKGRDDLHIFSLLDMDTRMPIVLRGSVREPGEYPFADSLTLFDLLFRAGGLQDSVYRSRVFLPRADVIRISSDGRSRTVIPIDLGLLLSSRSNDLLLRPGDEVVVYGIQIAESPAQSVFVFGKVKKPGEIQWKTNMTITDAILEAGGYTDDAWGLQAEVARYEEKGIAEDSLGRVYLTDLPDLSDSATLAQLTDPRTRDSEFRLRRRDFVFVREDPSYRRGAFVSLEGEVKFPGPYPLQVRNETLSRLIVRAGGATITSFLEGGIILRNGRRVIADIAEAVDHPGGTEDIILQRGDTIRIPVKPNAVEVFGEVNNPGILGFIRGDDLSDYVDRAGGTTDSADYVLLEYPNGNVTKHSVSGLSSIFSSDPSVWDGSRIRVTRTLPVPPEERVDWSTTIKDILALTASVLTIAVLANRL